MKDQDSLDFELDLSFSVLMSVPEKELAPKLCLCPSCRIPMVGRVYVVRGSPACCSVECAFASSFR
jgi:hypothetical protein